MHEVGVSFKKSKITEHLYVVNLDLPSYFGEISGFEELRKKYASLDVGLKTIVSYLGTYICDNYDIGIEADCHLSLTSGSARISLRSKKKLSRDKIKKALDHAIGRANDLSIATKDIDKLPPLDLKLRWKKE